MTFLSNLSNDSFGLDSSTEVGADFWRTPGQLAIRSGLNAPGLPDPVSGHPKVAPDAATATNPVYTDYALPFVVAAKPGSTVSLTSILKQMFGSDTGGYQNFWVAYYGQAQLKSWDFNYWNPDKASVAKWLVNGSDIGASTDASFNSVNVSSDLSSVQLQAGNDIGDLAYITVATAYDANGNAIAYAEYTVTTVDPSLIAKNAGKSEPTAADIVKSAEAFAKLYSGVPNDNDCHKIACALAGAAGAILDDYVTGSLNPKENESNGFWRVVYRGSQANPVTDWQTLVKPGDIVRMGWQGGGQHTCTVLAVNSDGSIKVFDNDDFSGQTEIIGIHDVNYDQSTIPSSITIYRLSTDGLYLINGTNVGERMVGTSFNDEILGLGGNDTILGGVGNDVLNGGKGNDNLDGGTGNDKLLPGTGKDVVTGDAGNDTIDFTGGKLIGADKVDGRAGTDTVVLAGLDYTGTSKIVMNSTTMVNVEKLKLGAGHNYDITTADATVASGKTLAVNGSALGAKDHLTFNGAAETNGHFKIEGGLGSDTLTGGKQSDTFVYAKAGESTSTHYDTINAFNFSNDVFDVSGTISKIDKADSHAVSTASFDKDIAAAASSSHLAVHSAMLVTASSGTLKGDTFLVIDQNGKAGYQAGADLVIELHSATGTLSVHDFI